jgi:hypothetical protein
MSDKPTADKMLNIGPKSAAWLRQVGVRTLDDLQRLGAVGTFWKVKKAGFRPSLNLLYALAGAEQGRHWATLSVDEKNALVVEASALEEAAKAAKSRVTPARDVTPVREPEADAALSEPSLFDDPAGADAGPGPGDAASD